MSDPALIFTTKGMIPLEPLRKEIVTHERPQFLVLWTEYYDDSAGTPELVRRDISSRPYTVAELQAREIAKENAKP